MERLPFRRRRAELRGVQWDVDGLESMEEALLAANALQDAGIYTQISETDTGPVVLESRSDPFRRVEGLGQVPRLRAPARTSCHGRDPRSAEMRMLRWRTESARRL